MSFSTFTMVFFSRLALGTGSVPEDALALGTGSVPEDAELKLVLDEARIGLLEALGTDSVLEDAELELVLDEAFLDLGGRHLCFFITRDSLGFVDFVFFCVLVSLLVSFVFFCVLVSSRRSLTSRAAIQTWIVAKAFAEGGNSIGRC